MDGHITPSFAIGYNPRSPSPGKFLPPPSPANVFPLSNDIGGTPDTFYTLIARLPHLTGSIAFLFPSHFRAASPSQNQPGWLARKGAKCFLAWPLCILLRGKNNVECTLSRAAGLEPVCPRGISAIKHRAIHSISIPTCPPMAATRAQRCRRTCRGAEPRPRAPSSNSSLCSPCESYLRELSHLPPRRSLIIDKQRSSGILRTATGCEVLSSLPPGAWTFLDH